MGPCPSSYSYIEIEEGDVTGGQDIGDIVHLITPLKGDRAPLAGPVDDNVAIVANTDRIDQVLQIVAILTIPFVLIEDQNVIARAKVLDPVIAFRLAREQEAVVTRTTGQGVIAIPPRRVLALSSPVSASSWAEPVRFSMPLRISPSAWPPAALWDSRLIVTPASDEA